jgi:sec-independent protein translocase protein TatC
MLRKTKNQQYKKTKKQAKDPDEPLTFIEHIYELRSRLFWIALTLILASSAAFIFKDPLISFILAPLKGQQLVYLTIGGGFSFIFTVCLYAGAVFSIPVIVYHLYKFVQPVLGETSRRLIVSLVLTSGALAIAGAAFGYFVAIQASLDFLMSFAEGAITSSVTAESYLNFIMMYTAGLAIVFQLPLLLFMFDHIKPFPPGSLLSSQRYVIVAAVIIAAIITPTPDVVNQMIIAIPIIVIYQMGAVAIFFRRKARQRREAPKPLAIRTNRALPIKPIELPQQMIAELIDAPVVVEPVPDPVPVAAPVQRGRRSMDGLRTVSRTRVAVVPRPIVAPSVAPPLRQAMPVAARRPRYNKVSLDGFSLT